MSQSSRNQTPKYVYDLPYFERMELCRILDHNDKWEELGGVYMNFDVMTIQVLRREVMRGNSPTDELLTKWGHQNHTILELFVLLSKMQHYQAMLILKPFVEQEYHRLIYEGEQNLSRIFKQNRPSNYSSTDSAALRNQGDRAEAVNVGNCTDKINEAVNLNLSKSSNLLPDKISFLNYDGEEASERKILNIEMQPGPSIRENGSRRSNAQTVLMNQMDNAMALDPSDIQQPKLSKAESAKDKSISEISSIAESVGTLPVITFKDLEMATNGWDPNTILGKGGFGTVYKGTWKNTQVAIKRTRNTETDENHTVQIQQILGELKMLNSYRHDNILPLYGFSMGGEDPCLIYQYMPNGSLEDRLLCRQGTKPLSWFQRHNIATGTARGLQFLHTIGEKPLIHGDIKSANILLDSNFEPKIGDFGLAREGPYNHYTHMKVSKVHGTRPYLPDEFLRAKQFSTKVDTYSFGIVLFELATGLRAYDEKRSHKFLKDLIENSNETQLSNLVDKKCGLDEHQTFSNLIQVGKCCISKRPKDRPEMVSVLQELKAMADKRESQAKAISLIRQNSLTPTNPYEWQMLHDHLSQQRKNSPSPSNNFRAPSPNNQQPSTSYQVPILNNPFLPPTDEISSPNRSPSPNLPSEAAAKPESNKSSAKFHNTGIVPPHLLQKISQEQSKITPSIAVSPPSASQSDVSQSEVDIESRNSQNDEEYLYLSQCTEPIIPLISALGIKVKDETKEEAQKPDDSSNTPSSSLGAVGGDDVNTSAKGKALWILPDP